MKRNLTNLTKHGVVAIVAVIFTIACNETLVQDPALNSDVGVYPSSPADGPYNQYNPYDSVGIIHNNIVHACIVSMEEGDSTFYQWKLHFVSETKNYAINQLGLSSDGADSYEDYFLNYFDSTDLLGADSILANYNDTTCLLEGELDYVRRVGALSEIVDEGDLATMRDSISAIEDSIIAGMASGSYTSTILGFISVVKHSHYYWSNLGTFPLSKRGASSSIRRMSKVAYWGYEEHYFFCDALGRLRGATGIVDKGDDLESAESHIIMNLWSTSYSNAAAAGEMEDWYIMQRDLHESMWL